MLNHVCVGLSDSVCSKIVILVTQNNQTSNFCTQIKLTVIVCLRDGGKPGRDPDGGEVRAPGVWGAHIPGARLGPA